MFLDKAHKELYGKHIKIEYLKMTRDEVKFSSVEELTAQIARDCEEAKAFQTKSYWGSGHYNLIRHYYACLQNGEHFPVDIYEASKAVEIVLAATRSNGKPIILNKQR